MLKILIICFTFISHLLFAGELTYNFEQKTLQNWKQDGKWKITQLKQNRTLSLIQRSHHSYNLCYNNDIKFLDGTVSVNFKATSGSIDQGGGIMWRVQDNDNYYVARFNPLENNFRFYLVYNGWRTEIASATIKLTNGWHTMKIVQKGDKFEGYLDDNKYLQAIDRRLRLKGKVGVWSKADALSSFDNLNIIFKR